MSDKRRLVITGIGVVSPLGVGKKTFWNALLEGQCGTKRISSFDVSTYPTQVAGEIRDFDPVDFMSHKDARRMDRSSQMILAAAMMAAEDAEIEFRVDMSRVGVFTGTAIGGQAWAFREYDIFREKGIKRINPFTAISTFPNASSAHISFKFGCKGPSDTVSSGCVSECGRLGVRSRQSQSWAHRRCVCRRYRSAIGSWYFWCLLRGAGYDDRDGKSFTGS